MRILPLIACGLMAVGALAVPPTDNPVATYYNGPEGYPAWTDGIKWDHVIDMATYAKGATTFEKFEAARDELAAQGGGVLYYPAGTYDFSDMPADGPNGRGLMLNSGVVIRGEAPAGHTVASKDGKLELGTKFVFGMTERNLDFKKGGYAIITLEDALSWTRPGRTPTPAVGNLCLAVPIANGKLQKEVRLTSARMNKLMRVDGVSINEDRDKVSLGFSCNISGDEPFWANAAAYTVTLTRDAQGNYTGTYEGTLLGQPLQGIATGKTTTITPVTPRAWNLVGLCPEPGKGVKDVNNVGIAWVHLQGGTIYFGPQLAWQGTWATAGGWKSKFVKEAWKDRVADGTHPLDPFMGAPAKRYLDAAETQPVYQGAGNGRLVFGCVLQDAANLNDMYQEGNGPDAFYTLKFGPRIGAYGSRVFVANNLLPMSDKDFKYTQTTRGTNAGRGNDFSFGDFHPGTLILFDYNKTCGIDVNKDLLGTCGGGYFSEGVAVQDNWVFNHGHKGYNLSGDWVTIRNNVNDRVFLRSGADVFGLGEGWKLTLDGNLEAAPGGGGPVSDNLSRAFDLAGRDMWIDGNFYHDTGSSPGIDGEGILCQTSGGTALYSWAITRNRHEKGAGHGGYMGSYNTAVHGFFAGWNQAPTTHVGSVKGKEKELDAAYVANQAQQLSNGGALLAAPGGPLKAPTDVKAARYAGDAVKITWMDGSDNEVAFRVDRSIDGGKWTTIAYRPPHIQGHEDNPQAWVDFLAPTGRTLAYRVVAIDDKDSDEGASAPTAAVTLTK